MVTIDKINNLEINRLRISEQIEFLGLVMETVEKYDPKSMNISNASEPFKKAFHHAESRFKKLRNSQLTGQLAEKDVLRDNDIICLRMIAAAMTKYFDPELREAAELLVSVIDHYGSKIYDMNYEEETVVLRNLVNDLKTRQSLIDAVKKLSLKPLVANLEKNNNEFRDLYMRRVTEKTDFDEINAGEAIKNAVEQYRFLIRTLESKAFLSPAEPVIKAIAEINTLVQRHTEKIQNRENRRERNQEVRLNNPDEFPEQ